MDKEQQQEKIIRLTDDDVFAWCFGRNEQKEPLLALINAVFKDAGYAPITDISIANPFSVRSYLTDKKPVLDIRGEDETGKKYDIEMQSYNDPNLVNRLLLYWSRSYSRQLQKSERYSKLHPVITICLLRKPFFKDFTKAHNCFLIMEKDERSKTLTDHFQMHLIELTGEKLKPLGELKEWMDYILGEGERDMTSLTKNNPAIMQAHKAYEDFKSSSELKKYHWARWESHRTREDELYDARQQGGYQKALETARNMLDDGLPVKTIAKYTGLTVEEMEGIKKGNQ